VIDKPTVIVVGAGGSVPYGFPTGDKLKWAICDELESVEHKAGSGIVNGTLANALVSDGFETEHVIKLRDSLRRSGWSSIDEFLAEYEDLQMVGKAAVAGILIPLENRDQLSDPRDANENRLGNWYQQLFRTVFSPFEDIQKNKVTILTYNYDTSLETYLEDAMNASYSRKPDQIEAALRHVPVVHLHGKFTDHKYGGGMAGVSLTRCAEGIHMVMDGIDGNPEFETATKVLWEANEIYFIGFGYDENNLRRLPIESKYPPNSPGTRMGKSRPSLNIFGTAFGLTGARRTGVKDYFRNKGFEMNLGSAEEDAYQFLLGTHLFGRR
jgi:hypothetical protein